MLLFIVLFTRFARGFLGQIGVLLALVLGTLAAVPMGLTDFSGVSGTDWVGLASPFHFGALRFPPTAVVAMCVVMLVIFTESTAAMLAVGEATGRPVTDRDLARGLAADGLSGVLGGAMNSFMDTVFSQNVGLIGITRVASRYVTAVAGGILVALGLVPRLGAVVAALPGPVVGAAGLVLFATVTMVGVNTLRRVDLDRGHNLTVAAVALGVGLLPEVADGVYDGFPAWSRIVLGSGITSAALAAFLLNLLFHHVPGGRGLADGPVAAEDRGRRAGLRKEREMPKKSDGKKRRGEREPDLRDVLRVPVGEPVDLSSYDARGIPAGPADKAAGVAATAELGPRLAELQERLYASSTAGDRRRLLLVLQAWTPAARAARSST